MTLKPLVEAGAEELEQAARLHATHLPSVVTDMGLATVRRLYGIMARRSDTLGSLALEPESGRVAGLVVGLPAPEEAYDELRRPAWRFTLQLLGTAWRRPLLPAQVILSRLKLRSVARARPPGTIELLYLVVDEPHRGKGLAAELVGEFRAAARGKGYEAVTLEVEADNRRAIAFYLKQGFVIESTFREGFIDRCRMAAPLRTPAS